MSSIFTHFFTELKNILESLEFMTTQFSWAPSVQKFLYTMNYESENQWEIKIHEIRPYERTKNIQSTITCHDFDDSSVCFEISFFLKLI